MKLRKIILFVGLILLQLLALPREVWHGSCSYGCYEEKA